MPRTSSHQSDIQALVTSFVTKLAALVERRATERAREAVFQAFGGGVSPPARRPAAPAAPAPVAPRRGATRSSPKQQRARRLQGQYMGGLRGLSKEGQARVKAAREEDGMEAAIALAHKLKSSGAA